MAHDHLLYPADLSGGVRSDPTAGHYGQLYREGRARLPQLRQRRYSAGAGTDRFHSGSNDHFRPAGIVPFPGCAYPGMAARCGQRARAVYLQGLRGCRDLP